MGIISGQPSCWCTARMLPHLLATVPTLLMQCPMRTSSRSRHPIRAAPASGTGEWCPSEDACGARGKRYDSVSTGPPSTAPSAGRWAPCWREMIILQNMGLHPILGKPESRPRNCMSRRLGMGLNCLSGLPDRRETISGFMKSGRYAIRPDPIDASRRLLGVLHSPEGLGPALQSAGTWKNTCLGLPRRTGSPTRSGRPSRERHPSHVYVSAIP